ncbi:UDP-glucose/GDP-mannose dehydrogenase family protein [Candidatus Woesearchaeota archaeon]|nr:UDP-glucose/GDP-mannose dehydrogenase family protein [Candidatus Woesearchaeota archaeon]
MRITIFGTGYVGLVAGTCLADLGNDVTCVDIDNQKIQKLKKGSVPLFEPGLPELLTRNVREQRLFFTTDAVSALLEAEVIFIAVGTPSAEDGSVDLQYVDAVAETIGKHLSHYAVIANKSTVPVGTADRVTEIIKRHQKNKVSFSVVSNPEFLREGSAVQDFLHPDRVIVGTSDEKAKSIMEQLYKGITRPTQPLIFTDVKSAEVIKYAGNAMLATRISFMNEFARFCEKVGADIKAVAKGIGLDQRIGPRFLQAGLGYGGSCFPKDIKGILHQGKTEGSPFRILEAVDKVNQEQRIFVCEKLKKQIPHLSGKTIALWGIAFKPKTDDIREAPSLDIIRFLLKEQAQVRVFDPEAMLATKALFPSLHYAQTPYEALEGADALIIITEWNTFRELDKEKMKSLMKQPFILDARNIYEPEEIRKSGFIYVSIGRP